MLVVGLVVGLLACSTEREPPDAYPIQGVHPEGFANPEDPDFHGHALERIGWDLGNCARCHGEQFDGGSANVTCRDCHANGPDACDTCHQQDTGSHPQHLTNGVACNECHVVPAHWSDEGHVRKTGEPDPPPAEIVFGARAVATLDPAHREGEATFANGACANVYCHGDALEADGGGLAPEPRWNEPEPTGSCVRCHGAPPPDHVSNACLSCHPSPASATHIDTVVQVGSGSDCSGCHGSAANPAPPRDLSGNTLESALGVGAHQPHLLGSSRLRGPIACETCHRVPATRDEPGHIDTLPPAEVEPTLAWDREAQTCMAWCHGPAQPVWTSGTGAFCGSCHGVPPISLPHHPGMQLGDCATCHSRSIDAQGGFVFNNGISEHIDGDVDLQ